MTEPGHPAIIQGGMGVAVSGWRLARTVAGAGQLGVVSGVALDTLLARNLQLGDPGGHLRRALAHFPEPGLVERILRRYFVPGGIEPGRPFRGVPRLGIPARPSATALTVVGNFAEVFLAKEGHTGPVGINYLEKIQLATPAAAYGAMLAGVDYVLVGAGIPTELPGLLDAHAESAPVDFPVAVAGSDERHTIHFDPASLLPAPGSLRRPKLLAIISSAVLATRLSRDARTRPDGFVLETPVAGGHSAPPRGRLQLSGTGEPVYGPRDDIEVAKVAATGLPFWLAGGFASPARLAAARAAGAAGIQVGTAFALSDESGIDPVLKRQLLDRATDGTLEVYNDPHASPAGFPFKLARLPATLADEETYAARPRLCDLGYLRSPYRTPQGGIGYRCPAEPVADYAAKQGAAEDTTGRRCLCNGLVATVGLGQYRRDGYQEATLVTLGQDLEFLPDLLPPGATGYSATDVLDYLLSPSDSATS